MRRLEPEIIDLIKMLQNMGAIIELSPPRTITIEGVAKLRGVTHRILPDRNEAVSFACLAIATRGKVLVKGAVQDHLITFLERRAPDGRGIRGGGRRHHVLGAERKVESGFRHDGRASGLHDGLAAASGRVHDAGHRCLIHP